jgi:hypothetical protein
MSLKSYLLVGAGIVTGAALLFLGKNTETVKFDPNIHTVQKLLDIIDELYLEYACAYLFYYDIILSQKEQGSYKT